MVKIAIPNFCINFLNKTVKLLSILCDFAVAPFVGAWIKILVSGIHKAVKSSRTLRGCVDQNRKSRKKKLQIVVASSADAWIKMDPSDFRIGQEKKSHPLWCVD